MNNSLEKKLKSLKKNLNQSITYNEKILKSFSRDNFLDEIDEFKNISNFMYKNKDKLITNVKMLSNKIENIIKIEKEKKNKANEKLLDELIIFNIEVMNFGLGLGRMQVRLNASQLNNAISKEIDLTGDPDDPSNKRTYLAAISKLIEDIKPVKINFGSILEENMNARRYFMVIKQILKYIDEEQSIRFLIAECDYSLTVMTALYFSKLFGVDEKIDISPLFETEKGISSGHNVIATLLKNNHFRRYLNYRKKLSIQTGFSDAGRYLGQSAAVLSIEKSPEENR